MTEEKKWLRCNDKNGKPCKACDEVIALGKGITIEGYLRMVDNQFLPLDMMCMKILGEHGKAHRAACNKYYKLIIIEKDGKFKDVIWEEI